MGIQVANGQQMYIADALNNRIQEVARNGHTEWDISMTAERRLHRRRVIGWQRRLFR